MVLYQRRYWIFAVWLCALAGFVDALGFIHLGGFFVSFMSGNSTRFAVGLADGAYAALLATGLIGAFVLGVILGALVALICGTRRNTFVLGFVALILIVAAVSDLAGAETVMVGAMTIAMGVSNAVFLRNGETAIGVANMTGTLVKFGQRVALAVLGGERWGWMPYALLWLGTASGATAGALLYALFGMQTLWCAALLAVLLAAVAARLQ